MNDARTVAANSPANPNRDFMEWCLDWHLVHRSDDDLARLGKLARLPFASVRIEKEPLVATKN